MLMLATDLDRTLFPNGLQEYDGSMPRLCRLLEKRRDIMLVFVTGRNSRETLDGIREFGAPTPAYAVCDVGTRIFRMEKGGLQNEPGWDDRIASTTSGWNPRKFQQAFGDIDGLRLQPEKRQNPFKLSFYLEHPRPRDERSDVVRERLHALCPDADLIYSVDETSHTGLLDVLPRAATKSAGLAYLWKKHGLTEKDVVYSGDSGNDLLPLTCGCRAILVRNAVDEVRERVIATMAEKHWSDRLYCVQGAFGLNGYYVSGILEGLIHFGITAHEEKEGEGL